MVATSQVRSFCFCMVEMEVLKYCWANLFQPMHPVTYWTRFLVFYLNCLQPMYTELLKLFPSLFSPVFLAPSFHLSAHLFLSAVEAAGGGMGRKSKWVWGGDEQVWGRPQRDAAGCDQQGWAYNGINLVLNLFFCIMHFEFPNRKLGFE